MTDAKLWLDLFSALWMVTMVAFTETHNTKSAIVFKVVPLALAVLLGMSQAKALFQ